MHWIKNFIYNMKFQTRLVIFLLFGALVPFCVSTFLIGNYMIQKDQAEAVRSAQQTVTKVSTDIDAYFRSLDSLLNYYAGALSANTSLRYRTILDANAKLMSDTSQDLAGVFASSGDDIWIQANVERVSRDSVTDEEWFKMVMGADGDAAYIWDVNDRKAIRNTEEPADDLIMVGRSFSVTSTDRNGSEVKSDAVVVLDIRHSAIYEKMENLSLGEGGHAFFMDGAGNFICAPDDPAAYRVDRESVENSEGSFLVLQIGGQSYLIASARSALTGCRCVCMIPSDQYGGGRRGIMRILFLSGLLFACLVFMLSLYFARSFIAPLEQLRELMDKVEEGDFSVRFDTRYHDEIGELCDHFNSMVERMDDLVNRLQKEKQFRLEAELNRVQEQIKPHFLYNTLDTINWLARAGETDEVVKMVESLTNMFRLGLSRGKDYIPLKDEKTHVSNYLYIQKARYGKKLNYRIDIDPDWEDLLVPKLILQPLVENAIYHGIKLKHGDGLILVTGTREGAFFCLSVRDDGAGVEPERLRQLQEQLDMPTSDRQDLGFGLFYIADRVRMYYGEGSRTVIESENGIYTMVSVLIPLEATKREEHADV